MSQSGEIKKKWLSTYPKINLFLHLICSRNQKYSDQLSLIPQFAMETCTIDLILNMYFWFSSFCDCASFYITKMCLYNFEPLKHHFYIYKGKHYFSYFCSKT